MAHAASRVFSVTELLENILDYIALADTESKYAWMTPPSIELFTLQRVCRRFQAVIQGSTMLKRKMHMEFDTVGRGDLLPQILPPQYPGVISSPSLKLPSIMRIRGAAFSRTVSNGHRCRLVESYNTAITYLGNKNYYPEDQFNPQLPNDFVSKTTSKTQRSAPIYKAGSPSWKRMKLTRRPRTVHIYMKVHSQYPSTSSSLAEPYKTVIVLETSQETLGTFANKLQRLLKLGCHVPFASQYNHMKLQVAGLRESGWAAGVHLDRLRLLKIKHEQAVDCGRRYGECAFCYYATGFELMNDDDDEHEDERLRKALAEL